MQAESHSNMATTRFADEGPTACAEKKECHTCGLHLVADGGSLQQLPRASQGQVLPYLYEYYGLLQVLSAPLLAASTLD